LFTLFLAVGRAPFSNLTPSECLAAGEPPSFSFPLPEHSRPLQAHRAKAVFLVKPLKPPPQFEQTPVILRQPRGRALQLETA
jgi:hypothetical protein